MMNKLPPREKIVEAWSATADNRVTLHKDSALVRSSNGAKTYTVTWKDDIYTSNDNVTYWQGYAGYPIIAVLMLREMLPLNRKVAALFRGVDWTSLNEKHKRNYAKAVDEALESSDGSPYSSAEVYQEVETVFQRLATLEITVRRGSLRPPKKSFPAD